MQVSALPKQVAYAALACAILASPASASAGQKSANISVTATIPTNCSVSSSALSFGVYDPQHANKTAPLNGQAVITFACTKSANEAISITRGPLTNPAVVPGSMFAMKMIGSGHGYLGYNLSLSSTAPNVLTMQPNGGKSPSTSPQTAILYGTIPANQKNDAATYADSVLVLINF